MNRRIIIAVLFLVVLGTLSITPIKAQQTPEVYVRFPNGTGSSVNEYYVSDTFRVDIVVNSPDIGIWSWQVGIYFDNNILECTDLGEGDFFDGHSSTGLIEGNIHNDLGYVTKTGNSLIHPEATGMKGTDVLMWFEFHVRGYGSGVLHLTESPPDLQCGVKLNQRVDDSVFRIDPIILTDGSFMNREPVVEPVGGEAVPIIKPTNNTELPIWLLTIILPLVATIVFVKLKKKTPHDKP